MKLLQQTDEEFWKEKLTLRVKKLKDESLYVEGYANMNTIDRENEVINPQAWMLDKFNKSGIILFNHDQTKPIGKPVKVEIRNDGLYIKARISSSEDPEISRVRDLINEGILNCFSVGFKTADMKRRSDGTNEITKAELFEVSIVSVPANPDSLFQLSAKYMEDVTYNGIIKEFLEMKAATDALMFRGELKKKKISIKKARDLLTSEAILPDEILDSIISGDLEWTDQMRSVVKKLFDIDVKMANDEEPIIVDKDEKEEKAEADQPEEIEMIESPAAFSDEDIAAFKAAYEAEKQAALADENAMIPSWVASEEIWAKAKEASIAAMGEADFSFIVSWYLNNGGDKKQQDTDVKKHLTVKNTGTMPDGSQAPAPNATVPVMPIDAAQIENNPYLEQSKQTNVLLGLVVNLLQTMCTNSENSGQPKQGLELPAMTASPDNQVPMPTETVKSIKAVQDYINKLDLRLKAFDI